MSEIQPMVSAAAATALPTLSYSGPQTGPCPLCQVRPASKKTLYGRYVCKKCLYGFVNRRQFAYIIDAIAFTILFYALIFALSPVLANFQFAPAPELLLSLMFGLALQILFAMRDGFNGQSLGKRLTGVQVVSSQTGKPIGFSESIKRNIYQTVNIIPLVGPILSLIVLVIIVIQMVKGPRLGDGLGKTRVIWKKYERSQLFGGDGLACESCGYDLTGNTSGQCPECGKPITDEQRGKVAELASTMPAGM